LSISEFNVNSQIQYEAARLDLNKDTALSKLELNQKYSMSQVNQLLNTYAKQNPDKDSVTTSEYSEAYFHKDPGSKCSLTEFLDVENVNISTCS